MKEAEGKVVIVTGGSKGIGRNVATYFYDRGATVLICARNKAEVEKVCLEIDPTGDRFFGTTGDVSNPKDCEKLISFAKEKFGHIDVLINAAGIYGEISPLENSDPVAWTQGININLLGTVYCTRYAIEVMKESGKGKIVNFAGAGVGGKKPLPNFSAYYTSKIAVAGFTETIAAEIEEMNIQINAISPGAINTSFTDYLIEQGPEKAGKDAYDKALAQKESGGESVEKVCEFIFFLTTSDADHVTGRILSVKWDSFEILKALPTKGDTFKLRRIDNDLFYGK